MHLLATEGGLVARAALAVLATAGAEPGGAALRLRDAVRARLEGDNDRIGLEALALFESDPAEHPVPLLVILANKAHADRGYCAHLQELVQAARADP